MNIELIGIFAYLLIQVLIASLIFKRISTEKDYFLAGRSLGLGIVTFSVFATWFGAETCIGSAGVTFEKGLSGGRADPFGYTICLILMGLLFASRLWKKNLTTLGDLFKLRFSKRVEVLAVIILIPSSLMWAAAQIRAFGQILSASSTLNVEMAMGIAALLIIAYTVVGGLLADAITDVLQSVVLILGLSLLFILVWTSLDHPFQLLQSIDPQRLHLFPKDGSSVWNRLEGWMIPICGSLIAQELISRILASRSPSVAKKSCLYASVIYLMVGLIPVAMGLLGPFLIDGVSDPEQLLPLIARKYMPGILYVLFIGALVSAILSTVDSTLLAISSLVSHNLVLPLFKSSDEKKKVLISRITVGLSGVAAYFLACHSTGIYSLVEGASAFGSSGILVITIFALFTRFGNEWSALASLITGIGTLFLGEHIWDIETPYLVSLFSSTFVYLLVELVRRFQVRWTLILRKLQTQTTRDLG